MPRSLFSTRQTQVWQESQSFGFWKDSITKLQVNCVESERPDGDNKVTLRDGPAPDGNRNGHLSPCYAGHKT